MTDTEVSTIKFPDDKYSKKKTGLTVEDIKSCYEQCRSIDPIKESDPLLKLIHTNANDYTGSNHSFDIMVKTITK